MIDLDAIRARDAENNEAEWLGMDERRQALKDRRDLLAHVDALAAAARKAMQFHDKEDCQCVYCADLRALLGEK